jgi:hypothetical protein
MNAYVARAVFPEYGTHVFAMIVLHSGSKADVEKLLTADGWQVKRVSAADSQHVAELERFETLRVQVRAAAREQRAARAEQERRAAAERAERERERQRLALARAQEEAERRDHAINKAAGDLLTINLEEGLHGNTKLAAICAKALLFFDQASVNKRDLFTSIGIDSAEFQAQFHYREANRLVSKLVSDLNDYLKVEDEMARLHAALATERASAEGQANSIASRTHVFGGSGEGLLISAYLADRAVRQDQKAIDNLHSEFSRMAEQVRQATERGRLGQQLLEYRVKVAASLLLAACGKSDTIDVNLPRHVELYVLGY